MILLLFGLVVTVVTTSVVVAVMAIERATLVVVAWLALFLAQINVAVLVAGAAVGRLEPMVLLGATVGVVVTVTAIAIWYHGLDALRTAIAQLRPGSSSVMFAGHLAGEGPPQDRAIRRNLGRPVDVALRHPYTSVALVLVVAMYLWHLALALELPMVDYDGLALHATAVAHWVTTGAMGESGLSATVDNAPLGPAAISAWAATFTSSLRWMFVTQLLFAVLGAAAVADLARQFGARTHHAVLAGAAFLGLPIVALQATSAYADLAASGGVLGTWALLLHAHRVASSPDLPLGERQVARGRHTSLALVVVAGSCLGLAVGARPANLAAAGLSTVLVVVGTITVTGDRSKPVRGLVVFRNVVALLVPTVAVGGYWYVRNAVRHANPVYPFTFGPFGGKGTVEELIVNPNRPEALDSVGGWLPQTITSWASDLSPDVYGVDQRLGGFGPAFLLILAPCLFVFLARAWRSDRVAALGVLVPALLLLALQPASWWSRGTMFLAGVAAAAFAAVLASTTGASRHVLSSALVAALAWGMFATVSTTTYSSTATHQRMGPGQVFDLLGQSGRTYEITPYSGYRLLDAYPPRTVVGVVEGQIPAHRAPLYGRNLQRDVRVLPRVSDADQLREAMDRYGVDVVVVSSSNEALRASIDAPSSALRVVAERGASPPRTVLVERA